MLRRFTIRRSTIHVGAAWLGIGLLLMGCSSSPYAPVNQSGPIRSMDSFFSGGRTDYPPPGYYRGAPPPYRY
jgi:hypothetical protein